MAVCVEILGGVLLGVLFILAPSICEASGPWDCLPRRSVWSAVKPQPEEVRTERPQCVDGRCPVEAWDAPRSQVETRRGRGLFRRR